ncbi:MAG TPA: UDP-glucose/GDP-mannose dehydrogenase family protein [Candidatus Angelobacter sp.]|nr:UDP-glucose/GDP-mannose dehydrogenase family protein [Candidatus Angelobacter sp.]
MQISVIGSGYVGLVAATCLAELGHNVVCVDSDPAKIAALKAGETLIHEDCLQELLSRHRGMGLSFSTSIHEAVRHARVIFIAVGTPSCDDGSVDLSCVENVARSLAESIDGYKVIVEKSTVPVYTSDWIQNALARKDRKSREFDVVSNPEFLREGTAVTDFLYPDRIVVGTSTDRAAVIMREVYASLIDGSYAQQASAVPKPERARLLPMYIETSQRSAELIKHSSNAFLALKISFINAVANFCESVGADIEEVCQGIGSDSRIGSDFLRAGIGYGGSCFPKDVAAFRAVTREYGFEFPLLDEIKRINEEQRGRFIRKVRGALRSLKNKKLAVLGLAFKDGTDDVRESPAIKVIDLLLQEKCQIVAFDPAAMERAQQVLGNRIAYARNPYAAAEGADALLILTEWKEFANLDLLRIKRLLRSPIVLDGRNLFDRSEMAAAGLTYHSVGRPAQEVSQSFLRKGHITR